LSPGGLGSSRCRATTGLPDPRPWLQVNSMTFVEYVERVVEKSKAFREAGICRIVAPDGWCALAAGWCFTARAAGLLVILVLQSVMTCTHFVAGMLCHAQRMHGGCECTRCCCPERMPLPTTALVVPHVLGAGRLARPATTASTLSCPGGPSISKKCGLRCVAAPHVRTQASLPVPPGPLQAPLRT